MSHNNITILDLRDSPWVDGPGRTILDCAESLDGKGFQFIIGSFSGGDQKTSEYVDEAKRRGLNFSVIYEKKSFDRKVLRQIKNIISENDVDIIHCHDFRSNVFGLVCGFSSQVPVITTVHGWIGNNIKGKIYTIIDKMLLHFFLHIITFSRKTKALVRKSYISSDKITVISNALRLEDYKIKSQEMSFRDEYGLNKESILIGSIGRLSPEKGQQEFLKGCKNIVAYNKSVKLIIVGIGPDKEKLEKYVSENNLSESVYFVGFRKDMVNVYASLNLVVQSSYTEGMPNVILESLVMRVPVIATDVGGTNEIIENNKTGILIAPGNILVIEDKINEFLVNRNKYTEMAEMGKIKIINEFSHTARIKKLSNVYQTCMKSCK